MGKIRKLLEIAWWNIAIVFCGVLTIELIFGDWFSDLPPDPIPIVRNARLLFAVDHLYPRQSPVVYTRDPYGLRGKYSDPGSIDILTIGGSTTDQRYVSDGETYQDILADCLGHAGKNAAVVNAGADGLSTVGLLRSFDSWYRRIPGLRPRFVLAYVGINDVNLLLSESGESDNDSSNTPKAFIKSRSALWRLYTVLKGIYLAHYGTVSRAAHGLLVPSKPTFRLQVEELDHLTEVKKHYLRPQISAYKHRLRLLSMRIASLGAIPIFVNQKGDFYRNASPATMEFNILGGSRDKAVELYVYFSLINASTLEACRDLGGICIDLNKELEFREGDFYDYVHTTPAGSRRVGQYLCGKLSMFF